MDKPQIERRRWFHGWSFQDRPQLNKTALIIWLRSGRETPELLESDRKSIEQFKVEILNQKPTTPPDAKILSVEEALKIEGYETPIPEMEPLRQTNEGPVLFVGKRVKKSTDRSSKPPASDPRTHEYIDDGGHCNKCGFPAESHLLEPLKNEKEKEKEKFRNFSPIHSMAVAAIQSNNGSKAGKHRIIGPAITTVKKRKPKGG